VFVALEVSDIRPTYE